MNRRAAPAGARVPAAPVRSLLVLALIAATPAWAQEASGVSSMPAISAASPVTPAANGDASTSTADDMPEAASTPPAPTAASADEAGVATDAVPPPSTPADGEPAATAPTADAQPTPTPSTAADPAAAPPGADAYPADAGATAQATIDDGAAAGTDATAAESDFDQLYGATNADGSAAPTAAYDPWEPYNRRMHRFNNAVDRHVARPLARAYVKVVPRPVRSGVSNFFSNLGQPITAINSLLQGQPRRAVHSLGRFVVNSTVGVAGVFDPATRVGLENANEDFGQTLGVWGWKRSRYVELPFFGPRTLRDVVGMVGDAPLSPLRQVQSDRVRVPIQGLQLVDLRATLMSTDALREGADDDYRLVRDAWMQRRAYQIDGGDADTPDYLKDDQPIVPVNAMPVSGGH